MKNTTSKNGRKMEMNIEEEIKEKDRQIERLKLTVENITNRLTEAENRSELYRSELVRLKITMQDEPTIIFRNAPAAEILERAGIKIVYVDRPRRGKSKEQQAYERKYKKARLEALERDNYKCVECGADDELHVHHKIHREHGGTNCLDNLITLCGRCHADKHKDDPVYNIMAKRIEGNP
jgi:hypothetical protein